MNFDNKFGRVLVKADSNAVPVKREKIESINGKPSIDGCIRDYFTDNENNDSFPDYLWRNYIVQEKLIFLNNKSKLRFFLKYAEDNNFLQQKGLPISVPMVLDKFNELCGEGSCFIGIEFSPEDLSVVICKNPNVSKSNRVRNFNAEGYRFYCRHNTHSGKVTVSAEFDEFGYSFTVEDFRPKNGFSDNRYKRAYAVGRKMYDLAMKSDNFDHDKAMKLFMIGNLHNVCEEFIQGFREPANEAYLKCSISQYAELLLKFRQNPREGETSEALDIFYMADLTTLEDGSDCTPEDRIRELRNMYSDRSIIETEESIVNYLRRKNYTI